MSTVSIEGRWYKAEQAVIDRMFEICEQRDEWKLSAQEFRLSAQSAEARADSLAAQLQSVTTSIDLEALAYKGAIKRNEELAAQLATAQAERDEAQEHLVYLFDHLKVWLGARLIGEVEP